MGLLGFRSEAELLAILDLLKADETKDIDFGPWSPTDRMYRLVRMMPDNPSSFSDLVNIENMTEAVLTGSSFDIEWAVPDDISEWFEGDTIVIDQSWNCTKYPRTTLEDDEAGAPPSYGVPLNYVLPPPPPPAPLPTEEEMI